MTNTGIGYGQDTELDNLLDDLAGTAWFPGMSDILNGFATMAAAIADGDLSVDASQTLAAVLAGSPDGTDILTLLGHLVAHVADSDTNPTLRTLPAGHQELARKHAARLTYHLTDDWLHQHASEIAAAIDGI